MKSKIKIYLRFDIVTDFVENEMNLRHYEVSNFAKKGSESIHNMNYWLYNVNFIFKKY